MREKLVLGFVMVTVALPTDFPCWSVSLPRMVDVPSWPHALDAASRVQNKTKMPNLVKDDFIDCPFRVPRSKFVTDLRGEVARHKETAAKFRSAKLRQNGNPPRTTAPPLALAAGEIAFRILLQVCQAMLFRFITAIFQILRTTRFSTCPLLPSTSAPSSLSNDQAPRIPPSSVSNPSLLFDS